MQISAANGISCFGTSLKMTRCVYGYTQQFDSTSVKKVHNIFPVIVQQQSIWDKNWEQQVEFNTIFPICMKNKEGDLNNLDFRSQFWPCLQSIMVKTFFHDTNHYIHAQNHFAPIFAASMQQFLIDASFLRICEEVLKIFGWKLTT